MIADGMLKPSEGCLSQDGRLFFCARVPLVWAPQRFVTSRIQAQTQDKSVDPDQTVNLTSVPNRNLSGENTPSPYRRNTPFEIYISDSEASSQALLTNAHKRRRSAKTRKLLVSDRGLGSTVLPDKTAERPERGGRSWCCFYVCRRRGTRGPENLLES